MPLKRGAYQPANESSPGSAGDDQRVIVTVDKEHAGLRLDHFLVRTGRFSSRGQVHRLIEQGKVTVAGASVGKPAYRLKESQEVVFSIPGPPETVLQPQDLPLRILYEDSDLVVVDKPAGMVVHPGAGNENGTLVNALLYHCDGLSLIGGPRRPGIVHRLDKGTSGVLVVAKSDQAHIGLAEQFQRHSVLREYVGLVAGSPAGDSGSIEKPIGRHPVARTKMSTRSTHSKPALTYWTVGRRCSCCALVRFRLKTGRTHQIRVHMAELGHPIVGDQTYGKHWQTCVGRSHQLLTNRIKAMLHRPFLHAEKLGFIHPIKGHEMVFSAPMPRDLSDVFTLLAQWETTEHNGQGVREKGKCVT